MRIQVKLFFSLLLFVLLVSVVSGKEKTSTVPKNGTNTPLQSNLESKIKEYENKLKDLGNQKNSLKKEKKSIENQEIITGYKIQAASIKIKEKTKEIDFLKQDINFLETRLGKIVESISTQEKIFDKRIREKYKASRISSIPLLATSNGFSTYMSRIKYNQIAEERDKSLIGDMRSTQKSYEAQQGILQDKKLEVEKAKQVVESQKIESERLKNELSDLKKQKEYLLRVTKNDEARYQKLLAEAQRELNQILNAASVLKDGVSKKVKKGEIIGIQGSSGMSTGDHLHFGVYKYKSFNDIDGWNWYYSNYVNPSSKLKSKTVYWNDGCGVSQNKKVGKGSWTWPLSSPTISQGYGKTCWSNIYYRGKPHPAYDMYGPYGSFVYAVEDGTAYFCRNCLKDGGNGVFIFHKGGYMTLYWHLR